MAVQAGKVAAVALIERNERKPHGLSLLRWYRRLALSTIPAVVSSGYCQCRQYSCWCCSSLRICVGCCEPQCTSEWGFSCSSHLIAIPSYVVPSPRFIVASPHRRHDATSRGCTLHCRSPFFEFMCLRGSLCVYSEENALCSALVALCLVAASSSRCLSTASASHFCGCRAWSLLSLLLPTTTQSSGGSGRVGPGPQPDVGS